MMSFCNCKSKNFGPKTLYATRFDGDGACREYKRTITDDPNRNLINSYRCPEGNGFHNGHSRAEDFQLGYSVEAFYPR
jgi:hypothetical protein